MSERAETFFKKLQTKTALESLIGQPEDGDFDCKVWGGSESMKGSISKAACGFANATGGVIVIGMKASGAGANQPDVVQGVALVDDVNETTAAVLDILQKHIEPGIQGVQIYSVRWPRGKKSGVVLVYIPESEGSPRRSRVDWKFYVRIASGTVPDGIFPN